MMCYFDFDFDFDLWGVNFFVIFIKDILKSPNINI